jgi:hypothetical protein
VNRDDIHRPLSAHASALLGALREAGDEGLPEARVRELGGLHWRNVVRRLCRWHTVSEWQGVYYLTCGTGQAASEAGVPRRTDATPASGLSGPAQLSLDVPTGSPHYREAA